MADSLDWAPKDPDAIRDYAFDWTADIGDAEIVTSTYKLNTLPWTMGDQSVELLYVSSAIAAGNKGTVIRIGAGLAATKKYKVTNHVVLDNGEEDERTAILVVQDL